MSRALDKNVAAYLRNSDPTSAYRAISQALSAPADSGLLDIEILGRGHPVEPGTNLLREGNAIAVPKLALVQAFVVARQILKRHRAYEPEVSHEDVLAATAVVLLMDPEHLTAANTRKRLLQEAIDTADCPPAESVARERHLLDSFLTSHLHRHTKSPTLWSHRRWLVDYSASLGLPADVAADITNVVMVSAKRHPRNYYAWCHARWLTGLLTAPGSEADRSRVLSATKNWCFQQHTDISGWSFLYFQLVDARSVAAEVCSSTFVEVVKLARSLRWTNESVWVFLRTMAASTRLLGQPELDEYIQCNHALQTTVQQESSEWRILRKAEELCKPSSGSNAAS